VRLALLRGAAAVLVASALTMPPAAGVDDGVEQIALDGAATVALLTTSDRQLVVIAALRVTPTALFVSVRQCDEDYCAYESGVRTGTIRVVGSSWRLAVETSTLGAIRLSTPKVEGSFASRGCSFRSPLLDVGVSSEGTDIADAKWQGTVAGRRVSSVRGPRCGLVHEAAATTVTLVERG
jgi:hypothetical protein